MTAWTTTWYHDKLSKVLQVEVPTAAPSTVVICIDLWFMTFITAHKETLNDQPPSLDCGCDLLKGFYIEVYCFVFTPHLQVTFQKNSTPSGNLGKAFLATLQQCNIVLKTTPWGWRTITHGCSLLAAKSFFSSHRGPSYNSGLISKKLRQSPYYKSLTFNPYAIHTIFENCLAAIFEYYLSIGIPKQESLCMIWNTRRQIFHVYINKHISSHLVCSSALGKLKK